ncbi:DapH/DapD/GlmU-related protein [Alicyclobacillus acidocaldarius]|nr:DapH/DapD/GlmU-related protein [Alicyclobacillus acidocaldarius]
MIIERRDVQMSLRVMKGKNVIIQDNVTFLCEDDSQGKDVSIGDNTIIRSGAIIYEGASIGNNVHIGHGCIIRSGVRIGDNTVLSHHVVVERNTCIGKWVRISALTHITGGVIVEDSVFIGAGVITVNDKRMVWKHRTLSPELAPPIFRIGARIGSGTVILPGVCVGEFAVVGSGSVVTNDVAPRACVWGNPAIYRYSVSGELLIPNGSYSPDAGGIGNEM